MDADSIIYQLLQLRGLTKDSDIQAFLHPPHPDQIPSPADTSAAIEVVKKHLSLGHKIAVYGDYDVDGLCSSAILWETLYRLSENVFPFIPHRREDGYGLSITGIDKCLAQGAQLIITVDNGIVASSPCEYCLSKGCDLVIIDHHELGPALPSASAIVHSTDTCAAGLTWFFCRDLVRGDGELLRDHLALAALATICDIVPLVGLNRSLAKHGLQVLNTTSRIGLLALFEEAGIEQGKIDTYHAGFIIGPRLNSTGRLLHAIESLRLLCAKDLIKAKELARLLGDTNRERQDLTQSSVDKALQLIKVEDIPSVIVAADTSYDQGIIGLIASKLADRFFRPSLAISVGPEYSKGSARSIPGFNITDHLRRFSRLLTDVGGHAMAAGFSLKTTDLDNFISQVSQATIPTSLLKRTTRVDLELPPQALTYDLYYKLQQLAPFGLGNPQPVFISTGISIPSVSRIGKNLNHAKFRIGHLDAVYFNCPPELADAFPSVDIIYQLGLNSFNGRENLQLLVKSLQS